MEKQPGRNPQQDDQERKPKAELREGGAMDEAWQAFPGRRVTETEPMVVETQAELKS